MNRTETSHTPLEGTHFLRRLTLLGNWLTSSEYTFPLHLYAFCFGDYIHSPRQCGSFQTPFTGCVQAWPLPILWLPHATGGSAHSHSGANASLAFTEINSPTDAHSCRPLLWPLVKTPEPLGPQTRKAFSGINFPSSDF